MTIEKPAAIRIRPMPNVQRRSKPVNGSVLAFALFVLVGPVPAAGAPLVVVGAVVSVGVPSSVDGAVPALGVGVVPVLGGGGVWL
jgi:hypothetical protein